MIALEVEFRGATELTTKLGMMPAELTNVMQRASKEVAAEMKRDFGKTTATWTRQPVFVQQTQNAGSGFVVHVGTDDLIYKFLDGGTRAHGIQPKGPGYPLRFQWGGKGSYIAKTRPGFIGSGAGGPSGPIVRRMYVWHPGTRPRYWSVLLNQKWQTEAPAVFRRYVAAWIRTQRA